jgi:hypothetical protein
VNDASGGTFLSEQAPATKAADQAAQTVPASGSGSVSQPGTTSDVPTATAIGPKIIKTADLSVEVKKGGFATGFDSASLVAQKYNGFVVSSSTQGSKSKSGSLLIRVPMQSFDLALNDLRGLGTVDHQSVNGQDVTSQFVDLNARLRTWQAQENVLFRLMNKAHSINDTMQVQRELQQVQFQIDANGILSVTASELRTEIEQTVEVKPSYGLTDEQVEQMLLDSFENAEADFAARLVIEARNEAENVIHATEKSLRAPDIDRIEKEELAAGERKKIESVLAGLKMVLNSSDRETIQKWTQALNDATRHLAEVMMNRSVQAALSGKNVNEM